MKKITLSIIATLALASCGNPTPEQIQQERERNARRITSHFSRVEFEGHRYVFYEYSPNATSGGRAFGLTHDPDCECHLNREQPCQ